MNGIDINNCPICEKNRLKNLYFKNGYEIHKCLNCGLIFINTQPSEEKLNNFYNSAYQKPLKEYNDYEYRKGKSIFKIIDKNMADKGRMLEIGCSFGHFLSLAKKKGWEVQGVEISKKHVEFANKELRLDVLEGTMEENYPKLTNTFDLIMFWHVLEHLKDPANFLNLCKNKLNKEGHLFFAVPNGNSLIFKLTGKYWEWMTPPAHLFFFSPKNIEMLLKKGGFKNINILTRQGDARDFLAELLLGLVYRLGIINFLLKRPVTNKNIESKNKIGVTDKTYQNYWKLFYLYVWLLKPLAILFYPFQLLINYFKMGPELIVIAEKK